VVWASRGRDTPEGPYEGDTPASARAILPCHLVSLQANQRWLHCVQTLLKNARTRGKGEKAAICREIAPLWTLLPGATLRGSKIWSLPLKNAGGTATTGVRGRSSNLRKAT
jgi:hypothetical protein